MSYTFLFLSVGGSGHVNPQLPLVTELTGHGHQVSYICCEKFKANIENSGAYWIDNGYISDLLDFTRPGFSMDPADIFPTLLVQTAQADLQTYYTQLIGQKFDAIVFDTFSLAGTIISREAQIPGINLWSTAVLTDERDKAIAAQQTTHVTSHWEITDEFLASYGIYDIHPPETLGKYNIAFIPRFFQENEEDFPDNFYFIGPNLGDRLGDEVWSSLEPFSTMSVR